MPGKKQASKTSDPGVSEYLDALEGEKLEAAKALRQLIQKTVPGATELMKWKRPVYEAQGLLCYLHATKKHLNFGFFQGDKLQDPEGLLEGTGKGMRHIKIRNMEDVRRAAFTDLLRQAARLNQEG